MTARTCVARRLMLCFAVALLAVLSAGCDETNQAFTQLTTDQLQSFSTFLIDFGRELLAAWLL